MVNQSLNETAQYMTITGSSRDECRDKLFKLYGTNYQIVNSHLNLKRGFLGFFQREEVVVQYIVKNNCNQGVSYPSRTSVPVSSSFSFSSMNLNPQVGQPVMRTPIQDGGRFSSNGGYPYASKNDLDTFIQNRDAILKNSGESNVTSSLQIGQLSKQLIEFQKNMEQQMQQIVQVTSAQEEHPSIRKISEILEENEFTKSYIEKISSRMKSEFAIDELEDFDYVQKKVLCWIAESIPVGRDVKTESPEVVVLVGPTGVGKTTTIAKMGASITLDFKNNMGDTEKYKFPPRIRMITTDTMRVAAEEQLARWAEIMNIKVDKAETCEDLKQLCDNYSSNSEYIFIDTAGYSPNDFEKIAKMHSILDVKNLHEKIFLTVNAGVSSRDFENILRKFEAFNYSGIIITKCDETTAYGRVISILSEKKKDLMWITTGQDIMRTIEKPTPAWFIKRLSGFKIDDKDIEKRYGNADK